MFLFLLLVFMVVWAFSLAGATQLAWPRERECRVDDLGPFAIGSLASWIEFHSRALDLAKAAGYCSAVCGAASPAPGLGGEAWPLSWQESNVGLMRLCVPTSWSKRLSLTGALLLLPSPKHVIPLVGTALGRGKQRMKLGSWLLSPAR